MLRAIDHTLRSPILVKLPVSIPLLHQLVQLCNQLGTWGLVFKCAILFCFFGFLRQSNVAPRSPQLFDVTRDTLRSDVSTSTQGLIIRLKWTKTYQGAHHPILIPLPRIRGSQLCPTLAFQHMCTALPSTAHNTPLLIYHSKGPQYTIVTTRMLAKQFNQLIHRLNLPPSTYTLHSLRKGGATLCHSLGVPLDLIKSHGTWSSNTVWTYLNPSSSQKSVIANAMSQAVSATVNK
jgi:hypothetical protein